MSTTTESENTDTETTEDTGTKKGRSIPWIYLGLAFLCTISVALDKVFGFNPRPTEVAAAFTAGLAAVFIISFIRHRDENVTRIVRALFTASFGASLAAACLAAAEVNNNGWYLVATVLVGIAATVYVLRSKIDEYISLTAMFCVTAVQIGVIDNVLS